MVSSSVSIWHLIQWADSFRQCSDVHSLVSSIERVDCRRCTHAGECLEIDEQRQLFPRSTSLSVPTIRTSRSRAR